MSRKALPVVVPMAHSPASHPAPTGLSVASEQLWVDLLAAHDFSLHERAALVSALRWSDVSTRLMADADTATEAKRSRLLRLSMAASTCSLKFWRSLKFGVAPRRPGRPSDENWSAQRRQQAAVRVK